MSRGIQRPRRRLTPQRAVLLVCLAVSFGPAAAANAQTDAVRVQSPDGRNAIELDLGGGGVKALTYAVTRDGRTLIGPSLLGPALADVGDLGVAVRILNIERGEIDERFDLPWGSVRTVRNHCTTTTITLARGEVQWQVQLRAYDDGVAFRYVLPEQDELREEVVIQGESTQFAVAAGATALFNMLDSFTTSHESLYERKPLADIPVGRLIDMPMLFTWPEGPAAAITEARVLIFAGMYLQRPSADSTTLVSRLSPLPSRPDVSVVGPAPVESPWRVVLLADRAGELLESQLLLCLNDPPQGDFSWAIPGKTAFHWWNGEFEEDFKAPNARDVIVARHKAYIDFCAEHNIAYHGVSGDGLAWYAQSSDSYGAPSGDADVRVARAEMGLPEVLAYAKERGVGIRLWVHWKPLAAHLEEAFALYESWGVKGLMVDFLDRDDQEMIEWSQRMLECAARHHLHIQIHGSSKYSGEQRRYPNLFNREGVLNLEYLKWTDLVTPDHNVNVAYTRALAGPVDYHLGGFRSVSRAKFEPVDRPPVVLGTRCHHLALYVVYENPMPMVADRPAHYEGQPGFDFIEDVPVTWDETRFVAGEASEYVVLARRRGDAWYLGGITNWTSRELDVPLDFLPTGEFEAKVYADGSLDEELPNEVRITTERVSAGAPLRVALAPGGGFTAILRKAQ
jgi:alpha-glucosidase